MKIFQKTGLSRFFRRLPGPKGEIFTTKDPFFRILTFALIVGFALLVMRFLLTPTIFFFALLPLYFLGLGLLNYILTPMIQEPQAIFYVLQSFL